MTTKTFPSWLSRFCSVRVAWGGKSLENVLPISVDDGDDQRIEEGWLVIVMMRGLKKIRNWGLWVLQGNLMVIIGNLKTIRSRGLWVLQDSLSVEDGILSGEGTQRLFVRKMCWYVWTHQLHRYQSHVFIINTRPPRHIIVT